MVQVQKAWERFLSDGKLLESLIRPVVAQSWKRCAQLQIGAGRRQAPLLTAGELHRRRVLSARLIAAAAPALERSRTFLAQAQSMLILSDATGLIIATEGDPRVIDQGHDNHLEPGGHWQEAQMGTNAIGTALAERMPVQIHGTEHYCSEVKGWTCAAAPIVHTGQGRLLGAVDISSRAVSFNPQSMALAISIGSEIERELDRMLRIEHEKLLRHFLARRAQAMTDDTLLLDRHGMLLHASREQGRQGEWEESGMARAVQARPADEWQEVLRRCNPGAELELVERDGETVGALVFLRHPAARPALSSRPAARAVPGTGSAMALRDINLALEDVLGESPAIVQARDQALNLAGAGLPLLIEGETGTGKELFARAIHAVSRGGKTPFIPVNCGGIARELIASELFGYARGSFTGADERGRTGRIVAADGGTLCLDEIGEMPAELQPYLLRVLEDGVVYPVGSQSGQRVDISLVSMTNRSLINEIGSGRFRSDLYYRIAAATIVIPPLRARGDDVVLLALHFARKAAERLSRPVPRFSKGALDVLRAYGWPGNVRQLRNVIEMVVVLASDGVIHRAHLPAELLAAPDGRGAADAALEAEDGLAAGRAGLSGMQHLLRNRHARTDAALAPDSLDTLRESQRAAIIRAIDACGGNMTEVARRLGIARSTLYLRLNEYGIGR